MNQLVLSGILRRIADLCEMNDDENEDPIQIDSIINTLKYLKQLNLSTRPIITAGPEGYLYVEFRDEDNNVDLGIRFFNNKECDYISLTTTPYSSGRCLIDELPLWEDKTFNSFTPLNELSERTKDLDKYEKFCVLRDIWKEETSILSNTEQIASHPAYQMIMSMGFDAVQFILYELIGKPDHWFYALQTITGEDPVRAESVGNIPAMAEDWIKWGKEKGIIFTYNENNKDK